MTYKILLLVFIFGNWCNGQNSSSPYVQYSSLITQGESLVLKENFRDAEKYYSAAFKVAKPIASDCFTAMQIAAVNLDNRSFKNFLVMGLQSGLRPKDVTSDSLLNNYVKRKRLAKYLETKYRINRVKYENSIDYRLSDALNVISKIDNRYKILYLDSLSNSDTLNREIYFRKYDSIVLNLVENRLIPLVEKHGFPGQRLVGFEKVGQPSDPYNYSFSNNKALFILLHYYSYPRSCKYNALFLKQVLNGYMRPELFASIMDFQFKYGNDNSCKAEPYNQWHYTDDASQFERINQKRAAIGLGAFQEEKKKYARGLNICYDYANGKFEHIRLFYWCG